MPVSPWFVVTGSFDILHKGHRSVLRQAALLAEAFSPRPLYVIALSTNPKKDYLLSAEDKVTILRSWIREQSLNAEVHVTSCDSREQGDAEFERVVGKAPTAPEILLISGIKKEDIAVFRNRNRRHRRNTSIWNEKKVFVVADDDEGVFGSSTSIKAFLAERARCPAAFKEAIKHLVAIDEIDHHTAQVLLGYRERILQLYGQQHDTA